jgi:ketosteroid isomerase-like protein
MAITPQRARELAAEIASSDRAVQGAAYQTLLAATESRVPWADDIWHDIVGGLGARDNRLRSICAQVLANLAAHSDPRARVLDDLDALAAVMADERFVTARHATQAFWKVGLGRDEQRRATVAALSRRFHDCADEKNTTLVRTDIITALAHLDGACPDANIEQIASDLISEEVHDTQRRKQTTAWKKARTRAP